jgi:hypothetical protein
LSTKILLITVAAAIAAIVIVGCVVRGFYTWARVCALWASRRSLVHLFAIFGIGGAGDGWFGAGGDGAG